MTKWLRRLLFPPCPVHDRPPSPLKIAELEAATGINPDAVSELWAMSWPDIPDHFDPDLTDCGRRRCQRRHGHGGMT